MHLAPAFDSAPEDLAERLDRRLREAARLAFHGDWSVIDTQAKRTIAKTLASYAFAMGPDVWSRPMAGLLLAWGEYRDHDVEAAGIDDECGACPF